jgi:hypothetical protein
LGTLNEDEKRELRSVARSAEIREEFRQLRTPHSLGSGARIDVDLFVSFLTTMARLRPESVNRKTFLPYTDVWM